GLTNLTALYLFDNNISDITPLAGLTKLNYLWLFNNNVSDITPLASLTNLITLELFGNNISDITPLTGFVNLIGLYLHNNRISDITPLASLKNLKGLGLCNNSISDISPLANLRNLKGLDLRQNPLDEQAYTLWISQITANNPGISIHLWYDPYYPGTLAVTYPKGGEKLYGGTRKTIIWESDGITQVEIEFSDDGGQTWAVIASEVPSVDGSNEMFWIVPQLKSAQCLIRVVKTSDADVTADSDEWFTINRCSISVYEGDLTGDCRVDMADSAIVASNWLKNGIEDE
ncbi:MAG: leucine-rich repeat domain-containing protein, partial [Sedimentisphaerales bacterium]|nr:leucine-rich repeat domain-containing protein [Sedimentisphaerales bacterium]